MLDQMLETGDRWASGGTMIVAAEQHREEIIYAELDLAMVRAERQNFDPSGHYSRPDVLKLTVDRSRRTPATFLDD